MQFLLKGRPSKMVVFYQVLFFFFLQNLASAKKSQHGKFKILWPAGVFKLAEEEREKKNIRPAKRQKPKKACGQDFLGYRPPKSFQLQKDPRNGAGDNLTGLSDLFGGFAMIQGSGRALAGDSTKHAGGFDSLAACAQVDSWVFFSDREPDPRSTAACPGTLPSDEDDKDKEDPGDSRGLGPRW